MKKSTLVTAWQGEILRLFDRLRGEARTVHRRNRNHGFHAAEIEVLEERSLLSAAVYDVATALGWGTTAPTYSTNLAYSSADTWQSLNIVNYSPSHYADVNSSWQLSFPDGTALGDTTFQSNLQNDSNFLYTHPRYGTFVNYIQGNPSLTIYQDLAQLQAAGFDGVRLYAIGPQAEIATIMAAHQLSLDTGNQFYVELEVFAPDLSQAQYYGGTVDSRIQTLFTQEVAATPAGQPGLVEGGLQQLHYVINIVGAELFSKTVPLVFFGHEDLVQPTSDVGQPLTDDNSSVPLLQWGINATRAVLAYDLTGQANLPSVTTALVAGQVVDVSVANNGEIAKLIDTIQTDTNAPIAYDVYAFQWANTYFDNTLHAYNNDNSVIPNAYPPNAQYYDRTAGWTSGPPPAGPNFTVDQAVTNANLMWSLQWMADRVNWIWGSPQGQGGVAKQLFAETGWASAQPYTQTLQGGGAGKEVTGTLADAQTYFSTIKTASFKVGGAPIMYFEAYDEPVKETNASQYSENHYGIYGWTGVPKFATPILPANTVSPPLTQPFTVVGITPTNPYTNGVAQADTNKLPTDTAYTLAVTNAGTPVKGKAINVPWFWGSSSYSDGKVIWQSNSVTWMPNPSILLNDLDVLTVTSLDPGLTLSASIQLQFNSDNLLANTVTYYTTSNAGQTLTAPSGSFAAQGSAWQLYTSFAWLHGGSNDYNNTTLFPLVYQDFWGSGAGMMGANLLVTGTPGDDVIRVVRANAASPSARIFPWNWQPPTEMFEVFVNNVSLGTFGPVTGKIIIHGFDGNDSISVDRMTHKDAIIYGGPGDDRLSGGRGNDWLYGGLGRDILLGNGGFDRRIDDHFRDWFFTQFESEWWKVRSHASRNSGWRPR